MGLINTDILLNTLAVFGIICSITYLLLKIRDIRRGMKEARLEKKRNAPQKLN